MTTGKELSKQADEALLRYKEKKLIEKLTQAKALVEQEKMKVKEAEAKVAELEAISLDDFTVAYNPATRCNDMTFEGGTTTW